MSEGKGGTKGRMSGRAGGSRTEGEVVAGCEVRTGRGMSWKRDFTREGQQGNGKRL